MPSEPPDSLFKSKVTIAAYPTWEGGGVVWTYMGPREHQPPPPDYEWMRVPATHSFGFADAYEEPVTISFSAGRRVRRLALVLLTQRIA